MESEPTLYQGAEVDNEAAALKWVVPLVRCKHGNIGRHPVIVETDAHGWSRIEWCAGIGGDDE